jgi:hypothetical protein
MVNPDSVDTPDSEPDFFDAFAHAFATNPEFAREVMAIIDRNVSAVVSINRSYGDGDPRLMRDVARLAR